MYAEYVAGLSEDSPYYVTYREYVAICSDFYRAIMKEVLEKGSRFKMPFKMGDICVTKKKLKLFDKNHLPINWELSKKLGKQIYHINDHTNNFKYRFRWSKKMCHSTPNIGEYRMIFTRYNKRRLAELIKSGDYDYIEDGT